MLCSGWDAVVGRWLGLGRMLERMRAGLESLGWM